MKPLIGIAALLGSTAVFGHDAQAQTVEDPLFQGRALTFSAGIYAPFNTLGGTLTTPNGGGARVQSTDALDFGAGARIDVTYSELWSGNSRIVFNFAMSQAAGEENITIAGAGQTFPGSYDDGFLLPAGFRYNTTLKTETEMLSIGREWDVGGGWRVNAGLKAGQASQDFMILSYNPAGALSRTLQTTSENKMYGVFGGVGHFRPISQNTWLRLSGTVGVMYNSFDYAYTNTNVGVGVDQSVTGSSDGAVVSTQVSASVERQLPGLGVVSFEVGYDGLHGVGNGADTFLDVAGTATTAHIDRDSIGAGYISLGYTYLF